MNTVKLAMILLGLAFTSAHSQAAEVCGRVSTATKDSVVLADLQSAHEPIYMKVTNPEAFRWQVGSCVCARGKLACEESHESCTLSIARITAEDPSGQDCLPAWFP